MKYKRWLTICLICAAALTTLLSLLLIGAAAQIHREMLHEGLTQSQWYESAVRSYRSCSLSAGGAVLATLALWLAALLRMRRAKKASFRAEGQGRRDLQ